MELVKNKPAQLRKLTPKLVRAYHTQGDQRSLENLIRKQPAAAAAIGRSVCDTARLGSGPIIEYSKFITDQRADGSLLDKRARAYAAAGQWKQARADWLRAIDQQPALVQPVFNRHKQAERWSEAAEFGQKLIDQKPNDTLVWLGVAPVLVLAGDQVAYSAFCNRMVTQFAGIAGPAEAEHLIKSCLLQASGIDLAKLGGHTLAQYLDKGAEPAYLRPNAGAALALLAYRGGDAQSAVKYATESQKVNSRDFLRAMNLAVLAMAQHQLQHTDLARNALNEATQVMSRLSTNASRPRPSRHVDRADPAARSEGVD